MLVCSGCDAYCDGNIPSLAPAGGLYGIAFSCLHLLCDLLFCEPLADVILYVIHGRKHIGGTMYFYIQILLIKSLSLQLTGKIPKKTLTKCIFACLCVQDNDTIVPLCLQSKFLLLTFTSLHQHDCREM